MSWHTLLDVSLLRRKNKTQTYKLIDSHILMKKAQRDKPRTAILSQVMLPLNEYSLKECNKMNSKL